MGTRIGKDRADGDPFFNMCLHVKDAGFSLWDKPLA